MSPASTRGDGKNRGGQNRGGQNRGGQNRGGQNRGGQNRGGPGPAGTRRADPARLAAFETLRAVDTDGAYANLELTQQLRRQRVNSRDAAFATELLAGTCRLQGSYDAIVAAASGRALSTLQPAVLDLLRLGAHQLLSMRVPPHAAVAATVDLAAVTVGRRVTGLVNAVLRRVAERSWEDWLAELTAGLDHLDALALRYAHPRWIVEAFADRLPADELEPMLAADNASPVVSLAVRPGLAEVAELVADGAEPGRWSPYAAAWRGLPTDLAAVREGRAGAQDEGSQLAALALARAESPAGPWLDVCAGPGGKSALLAGLARQQDRLLLAAELAPHRAQLVRRALAGYTIRPGVSPGVVVADGTRPAWRSDSFAKVLTDVPCTGLGALRRRPESRWRRDPASLEELVSLQAALLHRSLDAVRPGGVVGYVTCSPHRRETVDLVGSVRAERTDVEVIGVPSLLPEVSGAADPEQPDYLQLWPHRHGTDAMFVALLRKLG